jgi:DNA polymerase
MGWEKFQATVRADEGIWLDDAFCQMVVRIYRKEMYPEIPALWKATNDGAIAAVREGGEHWVGGNEAGDGAVVYFVEGPFLHCRLPSGRLLAYLYPEVHERVNYRFAAINERGNPTMVMFPAKKKVPMSRVRWHAEKLAEKQHKRLLPDAPETFLSPHLSFMGRDMYTKQWKRLGTHGGTLVENYDQASSRDLLAESMLRVDQTEPFKLLLSIHDEVIAEAPEGTATVKEFEALMSEVPKWAPGMPIAAEGWVGPRLRK